MLSHSKNNAPSIRKRIEVVITGLTRNRGRFRVAPLAETLDFMGFFG